MASGSTIYDPDEPSDYSTNIMATHIDTTMDIVNDENNDHIVDSTNVHSDHDGFFPSSSDGYWIYFMEPINTLSNRTDTFPLDIDDPGTTIRTRIPHSLLQ